jgi:Fe2+ transport system protein FeoA
MTINEAPLNRKLTVLSFSDKEERDLNDLESRLMHLGFLSGHTVQVKRKAPLFQEPLLVEVRGRQVALSREEARLVNVEVQE